MNKYQVIDDIQPVLQNKTLFPSIVMWNRLEGRPRTNNFDRALKAEIRDPLFMLTKQWQMGEFKGDDAGTPVTGKVHLETTKLDTFMADSHPPQPFEKEIPLETKVEQMTITFSLDIRTLMGRQWLKMLHDPGIVMLRGEFITAFPIKKPGMDTPEHAPVGAHLTTAQQFAAAAGRMMDGAGLYLHLKESPANHAYDKLPATVVLTPAQKTLIEKLEPAFTAWFESLYSQPLEKNDDSWIPGKLEYQFSCSAPKKGKEKVLWAEEYYHGHLDWYNMVVDRTRETLGDIQPPPSPAADLEKTHTFSFFPAPIQFDGMPDTRWWAFEEGQTNFGHIKPDTTDLNKLLLMEFALIYSNDWYLAPITLPAGTIANVRGLTITNVFGERVWVEPTGLGNDEDFRRWTMYTLNVTSNKEEGEPADRSLLLLPSVPGILEGAPLEDVLFIRDEMANMVWGIERRVPLPDGSSKPGGEAAQELREHYQHILDKQNASAPSAGAPPTLLKNDGEISYRSMTTVPERWIPFIPVHVKNSIREIQLQRAAMPRILEGDTEAPKKIRPRTTLLRKGLDQSPKKPYKLFEEEVPRHGVEVFKGYQRTRWYGGRVFTWLGVRKRVGRGEGSSGLKFDRIEPKKKEN